MRSHLRNLVAKSFGACERLEELSVDIGPLQLVDKYKSFDFALEVGGLILRLVAAKKFGCGNINKKEQKQREGKTGEGIPPLVWNVAVIVKLVGLRGNKIRYCAQGAVHVYAASGLGGRNSKGEEAAARERIGG